MDFKEFLKDRVRNVTLNLGFKEDFNGITISELDYDSDEGKNLLLEKCSMFQCIVKFNDTISIIGGCISNSFLNRLLEPTLGVDLVDLKTSPDTYISSFKEILPPDLKKEFERTNYFKVDRYFTDDVIGATLQYIMTLGLPESDIEKVFDPVVIHKVLSEVYKEDLDLEESVKGLVEQALEETDYSRFEKMTNNIYEEVYTGSEVKEETRTISESEEVSKDFELIEEDTPDDEKVFDISEEPEDTIIGFTSSEEQSEEPIIFTKEENSVVFDNEGESGTIKDIDEEPQVEDESEELQIEEEPEDNAAVEEDNKDFDKHDTSNNEPETDNSDEVESIEESILYNEEETGVSFIKEQIKEEVVVDNNIEDIEDFNDDAAALLAGFGQETSGTDEAEVVEEVEESVEEAVEEAGEPDLVNENIDEENVQEAQSEESEDTSSNDESEVEQEKEQYQEDSEKSSSDSEELDIDFVALMNNLAEKVAKSEQTVKKHQAERDSKFLTESAGEGYSAGSPAYTDPEEKLAIEELIARFI